MIFGFATDGPHAVIQTSKSLTHFRLKRNEKMTYPSVLRSIRASLGISQQEMARRLGVPQATISRLELGHQRKISADLAKRIREEFGIDVVDNVNVPEISAAEYTLLAAYRTLPPDVQTHIRGLLDSLALQFIRPTPEE